MIRATRPEDTPLLVELARATGVFKPLEIQALREVLDDYHATNRAPGHCCVTAEEAGRITGFAYYAPSSMADRAWYLYWIAVRSDLQARGLGGRLLRQVEDEAERSRLWSLAIAAYPPYAEYQERTARRIPVFIAERA